MAIIHGTIPIKFVDQELSGVWSACFIEFCDSSMFFFLVDLVKTNIDFMAISLIS